MFSDHSAAWGQAISLHCPHTCTHTHHLYSRLTRNPSQANENLSRKGLVLFPQSATNENATAPQNKVEWKAKNSNGWRNKGIFMTSSSETWDPAKPEAYPLNFSHFAQPRDAVLFKLVWDGFLVLFTNQEFWLITFNLLVGHHVILLTKWIFAKVFLPHILKTLLGMSRKDSLHDLLGDRILAGSRWVFQRLRKFPFLLWPYIHPGLCLSQNRMLNKGLSSGNRVWNTAHTCTHI